MQKGRTVLIEINMYLVKFSSQPGILNLVSVDMKRKCKHIYGAVIEQLTLLLTGFVLKENIRVVALLSCLHTCPPGGAVTAS